MRKIAVTGCLIALSLSAFGKSTLASTTATVSRQVRLEPSGGRLDDAVMVHHDNLDQSGMDTFSREFSAAGASDVVGSLFSRKLSFPLSQRESVFVSFCFGGRICRGASG